MRTFSFILLVLILVSCNHSSKIVNIKELQAVDSLSLYLGLPTTIKLFENKLFIVDMFDENESVKIYDIEQKKLIFSFAKKGEGPCEYLHISDVDVYQDVKGQLKINIYDPVSSKLGIYDYDSLLTMKNKYIPTTIISPNKDVRFHEILKIDGGYLAAGMTMEGKYTILSDSLKILGYFGKYRAKPIDNIPDMSHLIANYGKTILSNNRNLLIEIIYNASVLSCYDVKQGQVIQRWEHIIHDLDYEMDGKRVVNKAPMGYLSASICDKYIYALYSGELENKDALATYGKEIHVYDYEGNIIDKYSVSKSSFALCVNDKAQKIYVLSHVPEPNITIYDIN